MSQRVAILGLGLMGHGMAGRLLEHGFAVTVWNRTSAKAEALGQRGAHVAATPAKAAQGADFVVAMLSDDDASRGAWLGKEGALAAMAPGSVAIECSTLTVDWVRQLASAATDAGVEFLDAPVTGSRANAEAGTLRFLVGGAPETLDRASTVFAAMGSSVIALGATGNGAMIKLINNFLSAVQAASLAEGLAMAERSGLNMDAVAQVLGEGAPGSPMVRTMLERMTKRDYTPNFLSHLMIKDLDYAIASFAEAGIDLPSARSARARFDAAARSFPESDISSVVEPIRKG